MKGVLFPPQPPDAPGSELSVGSVAGRGDAPSGRIWSYLRYFTYRITTFTAMRAGANMRDGPMRNL